MASGDVIVDRRQPTPRTAWLFDVDGVLTDPERKIVAEEALFDEILRRLRRDEPVGLNTGRSLDFIAKAVLAPLENRAEVPRLLAGMIAVGEKGGVWITYSATGAREEHVAAGVSVPHDLRAAVRTLVRQPRFSDCMFYDETKRTMISVELRHGKTVAEFEGPQRAFTAALQALLAAHPRGRELRIDPSRIATDVEHASMGKGRGAARFVALLDARGIRPERYACFGDSASDYAMLIELLRQGLRAEMIFVGERRLLAGMDTRLVTFMEQLCDKGTLSYLQVHE
jgi:phosphoserine phosphatase